MIGLVDGNNFFVSCERVVDPRLNGRPVAVLSNNDGCCVSRSNEFKALGIPMGTPYFQLKDRERTGELVFRSSNYELYGDMSRRVISILRDLAVDVEQYSIDEAFIHPPSTVAGDLAAAEPTRPSKLYKAVDALNARYGKGKVFSAAEGIAKPWKMKRGKLSPRATTNWNELLVVG